MEDMTVSPEQSGSSEQPDSLNHILRQDNASRLGGIFDVGIGNALEMIAFRHRLNGDSKTADRLEEKAEGLKLRGALRQSGIMSDLRAIIPREHDSGIVDGEVIETRKELE